MIIFDDGGDLGATAYVQLTPSDAEKIVYVRNDLSGSRSIILFQGTYNASNDYEVPAGTTAIVYFDGAGAGAVAANVFNNAYFDSLRLGSVSVTAILDEDDMASDSATALATQQSIKKYVDDKTAAQNELSEVLANGNTTGGTDIAVSSGDDITFAVNSKAVFGAGSDLQIYHSGSGNSVISEAGSGNLLILADELQVLNTANTEAKATFNTDGAVNLYYDGSPKLATTSTGVDVTGTITSDGLTVDKGSEGTYTSLSGDNSSGTRGLSFTSSTNYGSVGAKHTINAKSSAGGIVLATNSLPRALFDYNGDITFYDTSGNASFVYDESAGSTFNENGDAKDFRVESGSFTHMLFVDATNNRVGISRSNPSHKLDVNDDSSSTSTPFRLTNSNTTSGTGVALQFTNTAFGGDNEGEIRYVNDGANNTNYMGFFTEINGNNGLVEMGRFSSTGQFIYQRGAVFNEGGYDADFRVESDTNENMLFVDASANTVFVGGTNDLGASDLNVVTGAGEFNGLSVGNSTNNSVALGNFVNSDVIANLITSNSKFGGVVQGGTNGNLVLGIRDNDVSDGLFVISGNGDQQTNDYSRLRLSVTATTFVVNETADDADFRVESDTDTHMLFVDAGTNRVGIGSSSPANVLDLGSATANRGVSWGNTSGNYTNIWAKYSNGNLVLATGLAPKTNATGYVSSYESASLGHSVLEIGAFGNPGKITFSSLPAQNQPVGTELFPLERFSSSTTEFVVNDGGIDYDFRVESDTNTHALFVDAGNSYVGVNNSSPTAPLSVTGDITQSPVGATNSFTAAIRTSGVQANDVGQFKVNYGGTEIVSLYGQWSGTQFQSGINIPYMPLRMIGNGNQRLTLYTEGIVVNEDSLDHDFRVESDSNANAIFMDAGASAVGINTSSTSNGRLSVYSPTTYGKIFMSDSTLGYGYGAFIQGYGVGGSGGYFQLGSVDANTQTVAMQVNQQATAINLLTRDGASGSSASRLYLDQIGGSGAVFNETGQDYDFRVESDALTHALFVDASTNKVGVGTNSPGTNNPASFGLTVGDGTGSAAVQLNVNGGGGNFGAVDGVNSPNQGFRSGHLNGTNRYEVSVNNNNSYAAGVVLSAGGTSWGTFSDERRKTDLVEIADGLNKVATLRAVTGRYNYDADDVRRPMLIAQDVQAVLPEAVGAMTASMDDPTEYLTLNYTETIPLLVSALKDAKTMIETLEARITALENA
jgi:hypothetical protein